MATEGFAIIRKRAVGSLRINKFLSECGVCSRREADKLIMSGAVSINGHTADLGSQVSYEDEVLLNGKRVSPVSKKTYLAFNKPRGVVCTSQKKEKNNLTDFLKFDKRVTYAGRLDKDSEGLLILTDDGELINSLMRSKNAHEKEYVVITAKAFSDEFLNVMSRGVFLKELDITTRTCRTWRTSENEFHIILTQGLNRQIRRMCEALNMKVVSLKRIRIENIELKDLKVGQYRALTENELDTLKNKILQDGKR